MKTNRWLAILVAGLMVLAASGYALAQPAPPDGPPEGPPRRARAAHWGPRRQGLGFLRWGDRVDVEVVETDDGVALKVKPQDPERLEQMQDRLTRAAEAANERLAAARERFGEEGPPARPDAPGLFHLLLRGKVGLASERTDEGVTVTLTSEDAEVVERLQERVPAMLERARAARERAESWRERAEGRRHRRDAVREALGLLAEEEVDVTVEETDDGITVSVKSGNPEVAEQIREKLPPYFKGQKGFARMARRWRRQMADRPGPQRRRRFRPRGRRGYGRRDYGCCPHRRRERGRWQRRGHGMHRGPGPRPMRPPHHMAPRRWMHGGRRGPQSFGPMAGRRPWTDRDEYHEERHHEED